MLLPEIRRAPLDALLVADGFSCREQIAQATARQALHLADVLAMALREGPRKPASPYPERGYVEAPASPAVGALAALVALGGIVAASAGIAVMRRRP